MPDDIQSLYNETRKDVAGVFPTSKAEVGELREEFRTEVAEENILLQALIDKVNLLTPVRHMKNKLLDVRLFTCNNTLWGLYSPGSHLYNMTEP